MSGTPLVPVPARRRIRWKWVIVGIGVAVLGLAVTIGGAVASVVSRTSSTLDPVAEARTPGTARFEANDDSYLIFMVEGRRDRDARSPEDFECDVRLASERHIIIDGSDQDVVSEINNTISIGTFDAVAGPTTVTCEADGGDIRFVVDTESTAEKISLWIILGGVAVLLIGTGLILAGIFWKKPVPA